MAGTFIDWWKIQCSKADYQESAEEETERYGLVPHNNRIYMLIHAWTNFISKSKEEENG